MPILAQKCLLCFGDNLHFLILFWITPPGLMALLYINHRPKTELKILGDEWLTVCVEGRKYTWCPSANGHEGFAMNDAEVERGHAS